MTCARYVAHEIPEKCEELGTREQGWHDIPESRNHVRHEGLEARECLKYDAHEACEVLEHVGQENTQGM